MFGKHSRHPLGRQRVGKTLALHDIERAISGEEIEAKAMRIAGDDSRGSAANFYNIGVGHENFP
ncbi:MAG TPA: hypothetical protein VMU78_05715 [Methylocella sp.]|nr:hypothetical protein [Methylocella sp.]